MRNETVTCRDGAGRKREGVCKSIASFVLLKIDDAAVLADVDGQASFSSPFYLAVNGFARSIADGIEPLLKKSVVILVLLHPQSYSLSISHPSSHGLGPSSEAADPYADQPCEKVRTRQP